MALQHLTLTSLTENIPLTTTEYCVRARTQRTPSVPTRQTCQDKNPTSVAKHRLTGGSTWQNQGQWSQCGRWECMKSNYEGVKETKGIRKTNTHTSLSSFMGFFFFLSVQGQEIRPRRNYSRSTVIHLGRWWGHYIFTPKRIGHNVADSWLFSAYLPYAKKIIGSIPNGDWKSLSMDVLLVLQCPPRVQDGVGWTSYVQHIDPVALIATVRWLTSKDSCLT